MSWIKRNLGFVISGVVGLALLGLAGWYLYSEMQANQAARDGFDNALKSLRDSQEATPFPSEKNLELAREDLRRATNLAAQAKAVFLPFQHYANSNDQAFKNYVEDRVDYMQKRAKQFGVTLPADYYFTFGGLRKLMSFDAELIPIWIESMEEIKTLVEILVQARVNSIESIRRSAISDVEADAYMDFMNGVDAVTNRGVIRTPYEVGFTCFSGEMALVLEGFMRSSNCFLLKNIQVTPSDLDVTHFVEASVTPLTPALDAAPAPAQVVAPRIDPAAARRQQDEEFRRRYHMGRPGASANLPPPAPVIPVAPVVPKVIPPPVTVLSERPLRVTIFLEILKLDTPAPPPAGKRPSRTVRPGGASAANPAAPGAPASSTNSIP